LKKYKLEPNSAILAEHSHLPLYKEISELPNVNFVPGGATQNAIRIAKWILEAPRSCTYVGCVGKDRYAGIMKCICEKEGVRTVYMEDDTLPTGTCAVLITAQQRSLVANLSAAKNFHISFLEKPEVAALVEKAKLLYSAAYFLVSSFESIFKLAQYCAETNKVFCMNLSAVYLVRSFKAQLLSLSSYWDVLCGNETEACAFAEEIGLEVTSLESIALELSRMKKENPQRQRVIVITRGPLPTIVCYDGRVTLHEVSPLEDGEIVDTNAAGDAFFGGFLAQKAPRRVRSVRALHRVRYTSTVWVHYSVGPP
jgi:adenosine kinase